MKSPKPSERAHFNFHSVLFGSTNTNIFCAAMNLSFTMLYNFIDIAHTKEKVFCTTRPLNVLLQDRRRVTIKQRPRITKTKEINSCFPLRKPYTCRPWPYIIKVQSRVPYTVMLLKWINGLLRDRVASDL